MISHLPKSPVARFTAGLLIGLMLLGGPPLEALQGQVVLVPRESPPECLAPWLESPWLEVGSWQGRLEQTGGAVPASRQTGVDPGFSPWAQFLTPLRGAAFQALGAVSAFSGAAFSATDLATSGPGTLQVKVLSLGGESAEVPANRQVQAEVKVRSRDGQLLSWTGPVSATIGQSFQLSWRGATSADQATLDLYGGVFAAPPYELKAWDFDAIAKSGNRASGMLAQFQKQLERYKVYDAEVVYAFRQAATSPAGIRIQQDVTNLLKYANVQYTFGLQELARILQALMPAP